MTHPAAPTPRHKNSDSRTDTAKSTPSNGGTSSTPEYGELFDRAFEDAQDALVESVERARVKASKVNKDIQDWSLYYNVYQKGVERAEELGYRVESTNASPAMFAKATRSISSAAGNNSEKLLSAIGQRVVISGGALVEYLTHSDFKAAIKKARELDDPTAAIEQISKKFRVIEDYVASLVETTDGSVPVEYPDSLSIHTVWVPNKRRCLHDEPHHVQFVREQFPDVVAAHGGLAFDEDLWQGEVHIATEHKLSGELDSTSVPGNLNALARFRGRHIGGQGVTLLTAVVAPVTHPSGRALKRWVRSGASRGLDIVCYNEGIFPVLFGLPEPPASEYRRFVEVLESYAADGVVAYLTGGEAEYEAGRGWTRPPQGRIF